jgi:hypothetical protein
MRAVWAGSGSWAAAGKRKEGEVRWAAGLGWAGGGFGLDRFLSFFSFFFFQILFKSISNPFKFKSFTQLSPTFPQLF